ncbi:MAG: hypothetical protein R3E95_18680 [Thiolinea sp.]
MPAAARKPTAAASSLPRNDQVSPLSMAPLLLASSPAVRAPLTLSYPQAAGIGIRIEGSVVVAGSLSGTKWPDRYAP